MSAIFNNTRVPLNEELVGFMPLNQRPTFWFVLRVDGEWIIRSYEIVGHYRATKDEPWRLMLADGSTFKRPTGFAVQAESQWDARRLLARYRRSEEAS